MKGAVPKVARRLGVSEATVYRYLKKVDTPEELLQGRRKEIPEGVFFFVAEQDAM
jgi:Uncharacterized protein conserved in bacteria